MGKAVPRPSDPTPPFVLPKFENKLNLIISHVNCHVSLRREPLVVNFLHEISLSLQEDTVVRRLVALLEQARLKISTKDKCKFAICFS